MKNRRMEVVHVDAIPGHLRGIIVGLAVGDSALHAAAGQPGIFRPEIRIARCRRQVIPPGPRGKSWLSGGTHSYPLLAGLPRKPKLNWTRRTSGRSLRTALRAES